MPATADHADIDTHGARLPVPRSRGAFSGFLLIALGAWGALIPLIGPYVDFGYTPDTTWHVTAGRFWLQLLPGIVTALGGLLLLTGANRITTSLGGWLAAAGGAWFIVGPTLRSLLHIDAVGGPIHTSTLGSTLETLLLFTGLGTVIVFLSAAAIGRLGVVGVRDVRAAQRRSDTSHDDVDDFDTHTSANGTGRYAPVIDHEPTPVTVAAPADSDVRQTRASTPPRPAPPGGGATSVKPRDTH